MTAAKLILSALLTALAAWWMGGCVPALTETEAAHLAARRLADYTEAEHLDRAMFGQPVISSEPGHAWVFDYASDTTPRHLIRIYVNSRKDVEIHRMIEE